MEVGRPAGAIRTFKCQVGSHVKKRGNSLLAAVIFLFILAGVLRVCSNTATYEAKLTSIFIQETQGYYLMENIMHMARDYAYQITQNPKMPNIFLGVDAYRRKLNDGIINFKNYFKKEQIAPTDFPLQPTDWNIYGGPIFWMDKKKDNNDIRYLSEVFLLVDLKVISGFIPNWTMRMVQLMEIERNPLCDFQLYSEGDSAYYADSPSGSPNYRFKGPIQINGNLRMALRTRRNLVNTYFDNRINIAGNLLRIKDKAGCTWNQNLNPPNKYCLRNNSSFYNNFQNPYNANVNNIYYQYFALGTNTFNDKKYLDHNYYQNNSKTDKDIWSNFYGDIITHGRIYRPTGFDPGTTSSWWYPHRTAFSQASNELALELSLGTYNLCNSANAGGPCACNSGNISKFRTACSTRGLTNEQMTEKIRLVEMQKAMSPPALQITLLVNQAKLGNGLLTDIHYPYVSYGKSHMTSPVLDVFNSSSFNIIESVTCSRVKFDGTSYFLDKQSSPNSGSNNVNKGTFNVEAKHAFQEVVNNKLAWRTLAGTGINLPSFIKLQSSESDNPPAKLIDSDDGKFLEPEVVVTSSNEKKVPLVYTPPHNNYMYDRNRAKWIQILDIDISELVANNPMTTDCRNTIKFNRYWLGKRNGENYRNPFAITTNTADIRTNYISDYTKFYNTGTNSTGGYTYPTNVETVIDIGVRIINAKKLPSGGLSILCPFPLYIQGDFNTESTQPKAFIMADSITLVNESSSACLSILNAEKPIKWPEGVTLPSSATSSGTGDEPKIYAHVMTGTTHPNFWLPTQHAKIENGLEICPDLGMTGAFKTTFYVKTLTHRGSLMLPYYSKMQWEPPVNHTGNEGVYLAPCYKPDESFSNMRPTSCMPFYHRINRGRKTQTVGETIYKSIYNNIYNANNMINTSHTNYLNLLPNFLK